MKQNKQKIKFGLSILTVVSMITVLVLPVQAAVVFNEIIPYDWTTTNPCTGEDIHISGNIHMINTKTIDASGGVHMIMHQNDQDVSGVGLTSGDKYQVQGGEHIEFISQDGTAGTYKGTVTMKLISKGSGDNFILHKVIHATIDADGIMTITFDKDITKCQG